MHKRHQALADNVLTAFRDGLDEAVQEQIGEAAFERLQGLIGEVLSEELSAVSDRLERLLRELRSEAEKPELGL